LPCGAEGTFLTGFRPFGFRCGGCAFFGCADSAFFACAFFTVAVGFFAGFTFFECAADFALAFFGGAFRTIFRF
jgi:hypothetical protein